MEQLEREGPVGAPAPDVDALMERVRAGIADKLARGVYTQADLDEVRRIELEIRERADFGPDPADDIARLHASWDPLGPHSFRNIGRYSCRPSSPPYASQYLSGSKRESRPASLGAPSTPTS